MSGKTVCCSLDQPETLFGNMNESFDFNNFLRDALSSVVVITYAVSCCLPCVDIDRFHEKKFFQKNHSFFGRGILVRGFRRRRAEG